ncbi:Nn.00g064420.m01.CDS01 [Neocucurbitaria sp. VM-36]
MSLFPFPPLPTQIDPWITEHLVNGVFSGDITPLDQAYLGRQSPRSRHSQQTQWQITSGNNFLLWLSGMLNWVPSDVCDGKLIYNTQCMLYFILDQAPIGGLPYSTQILPGSVGKPLLPLSQWTVDFAQQVGGWMSQPSSVNPASIALFQKSPKYNYDEACVPAGGWKSFNDLFSRTLLPGMRPISAGAPTDPNYNRVITYPADSTFDDLLAEVTPNYAPKFEGGIWMHAFLNTFDYHRQHAPVGGTVVEANVIPGLAYLEVKAEDGQLVPHRSYIPRHKEKREPHKGLAGTLDAPDDAGYQFLQARGCVIIENELLGYVAVLPIGMCQVSSVQLVYPGPYPTNPNVTVEKGAEISHFEFGGSDIVLVFQAGADVQILGAQGLDANKNPTSKRKYLVGMPLGYSTAGMTP